jgi:Tfp pilus assembly protein PilZ
MASKNRASSRHLYPEEIKFETMASGTETARRAHYRAHCLDISQGGLGFSTAHELGEGEVVKLSLPLRDFEVTLPVLAEVLWVKPAERHYRVGVRYLI